MGGWLEEAVPISDVNFDKYFCCLSQQILDKNRERTIDSISIVFFSKHDISNVLAIHLVNVYLT